MVYAGLSLFAQHRYRINGFTEVLSSGSGYDLMAAYPRKCLRFKLSNAEQDQKRSGQCEYFCSNHLAPRRTSA